MEHRLELWVECWHCDRLCRYGPRAAGRLASRFGSEIYIVNIQHLFRCNVCREVPRVSVKEIAPQKPTPPAAAE